MTHDDPFADLSLASGYEAIVARMETIRVRAANDDPEALAAISLHYIRFLNRVIEEGANEEPDHPVLVTLREQRDMLQRMFGEHIAACVPGTRH